MSIQGIQLLKQSTETMCDARTWIKLTKQDYLDKVQKCIMNDVNAKMVFTLIYAMYIETVVKYNSEVITGVNWNDIKDVFKLTDEEVKTVFSEFIKAGILYRTADDGSIIQINDEEEEKLWMRM